MSAPRRDTRGIVDAAALFARVHFRRREPTPALRPYLEHYWLIDWDLPEPYVSHVVPHPSVNVVLQSQYPPEHAPPGPDHAPPGPDHAPPGPDATPPGREDGPPGTDATPSRTGEVAGVGLGLFRRELTGRGRVCGVQFRPGGFRPFAPGVPVSHWTGRHVPFAEVFPRHRRAVDAVLAPDDEDARVAALDAFLLAVDPRPDPAADRAMALVDRVRTDRTVRRVAALAAAEGLSVRALQRLCAGYVGVSPKWVILRYRIHEALERAEREDTVDWAALAADLGYADQAHLVRDFTATVGVPPTEYARR